MVGFISHDKSLVCNGSEARWFLPNHTEIIGLSDKFQITKSDEQSILTIKMDPMVQGLYKCLSYSDGTSNSQYFHLKLYCKFN